VEDLRVPVLAITLREARIYVHAELAGPCPRVQGMAEIRGDDGTLIFAGHVIDTREPVTADGVLILELPIEVSFTGRTKPL
jgi:hypothetical protein